MAAFITGKFNLNDYNYNPLHLSQLMDALVQDDKHQREPKSRVVDSTEVAELLLSALTNMIEMATGRNYYHTTISIGEELYAKTVVSGRTHLTLCVDGRVAFFIEGENIEIFSTDTEFMGIDKTLLREKANVTHRIPLGGYLIPDMENYLLVNDIEDSWHGRTRKILETTDEWLMRSYSSSKMISEMVNELVKKQLSLAESMEGGLPHEFSGLVDTQERKNSLWFSDIRITLETLLNHVKKFIPAIEDIVIAHCQEKLELLHKQRELDKVTKSIDDQFKVLLHKQITGGLPQVIYTSNTQSHPSKVAELSLWKHCTFLGSIGFDVNLELKKYDCGIWVSADGKEISATFVNSDDHSKYHSMPFAANGKILKSFTETCNVNRSSVITAIHEWIQKEAIEAKYICS